MLLPLMDMAGKRTGEIEVSDWVFNAPVRQDLLHQALVRQMANARAGTHKTKTRSEVAGGGRKPWRQKGTGRARHGSIRSPQWKGGGTVFGPRPRSYAKAMPKKMRRAAVRSALSSKAQAGQIVVIDQLAMDEPKTKRAIQLLSDLGIGEGSVLIVMAGSRDKTLTALLYDLARECTSDQALDYLNAVELTSGAERDEIVALLERRL